MLTAKQQEPGPRSIETTLDPHHDHCSLRLKIVNGLFLEGAPLPPASTSVAAVGLPSSIANALIFAGALPGMEIGLDGDSPGREASLQWIE